MTVGAATGRRILLGLAGFAMVWAIVRAHVQAVTIDEAVTYMNFVLPADPTWWTPHANNHILNSALMRVFTGIFGASNLAVRSGALIGAASFILASYFLCILIDAGSLLRVSLFVCLVFNPFIFDFHVAARGYGLASGFLLCAIAFAGYPKKPVPACVGASICVALSFLSNFSFAFVDAAAIVTLYLWASARSSRKDRLRLAAAAFLPLLLLAGAVTPLLLQWKEPLTYGAASLPETFRSLSEASFYELSPTLRDLVFVDVPAVILPMFGILVAWRLVLAVINWRSLRRAPFAIVPIAAVTAALLAHWILFRLTGTPLPLDRTGIYIVVLGTLFLGALAAVPIPTRTGELSRRGLTILMVVLGSYFLLCLRVSYFKEWKWDSDVDEVYSVLAGYNHACGLKDVAANWRYDGSLNYYGTISGRETFPKFDFYNDYPSGKQAYVVYQPDDRDFLANRSLTVVYQAPSGAAIALDPKIEPPAGESVCPMAPPNQSK